MPLANASRPMGFIPMIGGGRANVIKRVRPVPTSRTASQGGNASTDLAVGDAYAIDANGNAYRAGPNDYVRGIVESFVLQASGLVMGGNGPVSLDYITGTLSNAALLIGIEDPTCDFVVQFDTFNASDVGKRFNLVDAAPDSLWRQSRQTCTDAAVGAQFQALDLPGGPGTAPPGTPTMGAPDNAYGANARAVVRLLQTFDN